MKNFQRFELYLNYSNETSGKKEKSIVPLGRNWPAHLNPGPAQKIGDLGPGAAATTAGRLLVSRQ
jgi:hypothetical protein